MSFLTDQDCFERKLGWRLKPCLRCGCDDIKGQDSSLDGFFTLWCAECGIEHIGAFAESTGESWNATKHWHDLRPFRSQPEYTK